MPTLCIDARMAFSSGIGTYIREIVPLLPFQKILLVDQLDLPWCKQFEQIAFHAPIYSIREQILYPLKIPRVDLFWSPHYNVPFFPIRAKKMVATLHDACHLIFGSLPQKLYARWTMKRALGSDQTITVSQFSKKEIENRFKKGKLHVIPIGVNSNHFTRKAPSSAIREKYQLPAHFLLFVGNHKPHKNLERLKKASLKAGIELVAVGRGTEKGAVSEEELPILYSMAELFVFPSLYEGFGLPPLEAMSCGCPTAVSRVASIPEVCGDASLYFDPTDIDDMAATIQRAIQEKHRLVQRGFERTKLFSWQQSAQKHLQVFEEMIRA